MTAVRERRGKMLHSKRPLYKQHWTRHARRVRRMPMREDLGFITNSAHDPPDCITTLQTVIQFVELVVGTTELNIHSMECSRVQLKQALATSVIVKRVSWWTVCVYAS